nr:NEL domain-containing protein [Pseudomonas aegrilactucae]
MSNLRHVWLRSARLQLFPAGLLTCPFLDFVDLRDNYITQLPEQFFVAESPSIYLLQRNPLPQAVWDRISELQQLAPALDAAAGAVVPAANITQSRALWLELTDEAQLQARSRYWESLVAEPAGSDFFQLLTALTGSADFQHTRAELDQRVWRMLEAMVQSTALREEMFELAASPTTCVDSVSSTYSALEVRFLLFQAVGTDSPGDQRGEALLAFARRLFRLEQVEQFARADIQARGLEGRGVDEVEVSLAYRTRLAAALDLPGQPRNMQFAEVAGVAPAQIDQAQQVVLAAERTDQLATFISGRDFWLAHLRRVHDGEFEHVEQPFWDRLEGLAAQQDTLAEGAYLMQMNTLRSEREAAVQALVVRLTQAALQAASPPAG